MSLEAMADRAKHPPGVSEADRRRCRALVKTGSRTFYAASLLLPERERQGAYALYAFCRIADDLIDDTAGDRDTQAQALATLRRRLEALYAGRPEPHAEDRAFAEAAFRYAIPRAVPEALLEGFQWDAEGRRYDTESDLLAYAARVAGTVGVMMTLLMGRREPEVVARACDLGVAMQLTNIARDVGEDARAGRLYLPSTWLAEAGIDGAAFLRSPRHSPALGTVTARLLDRADQLYRRSEPGIGALPGACRPAIQAARHLYAEIGRQVERQDLDSISGRAVVPLARKLAFLPRILALSLRRPALAPVPPLRETAFLIDAVVRTPASPWAARRDVRGIDARAGRLLDLIARLQERDALARTSPWTPPVGGLGG